MKPRDSSKSRGQGKLFQARLDTIVDPTHPLVHTAERINWTGFHDESGALYAQESADQDCPPV